ncbi:MAG: hypothetical protein HY313_03690 [Acidobacteria bacterium]|nr:hypothetical protein [Acidobacteriota bacterium]
MATQSHSGKAWKILAVMILGFIAVVGISYGSLLREMDRADQEFQQGDPETALQQYGSVERSLRSVGVLRYIPATDRQNLFLNQARLLYGLKRYDEAAECLDQESEIAGAFMDGRFLVVRSEIAFRKAIDTFLSAEKKDPQVLDETLLGIEDSLREALRLSPDDWEAKFNLEFINYLREEMFEKGDEGKLEILEKMQMQEKPVLRPEQQG